MAPPGKTCGKGPGPEIGLLAFAGILFRAIDLIWPGPTHTAMVGSWHQGEGRPTAWEVFLDELEKDKRVVWELFGELWEEAQLLLHSSGDIPAERLHLVWEGFQQYKRIKVKLNEMPGIVDIEMEQRLKSYLEKLVSRL